MRRSRGPRTFSAPKIYNHLEYKSIDIRELVTNVHDTHPTTKDKDRDADADVDIRYRHASHLATLQSDAKSICILAWCATALQPS